MRPVTRKVNHMIRGVELQLGPLTSGGIEFNHVTNDSLNNAYAVKPQLKTLNNEVRGGSSSMNRLMYWRAP